MTKEARYMELIGLLFDLIGNSGVAALPMMLIDTLSEANPGDRILVANYGD